MQDDDDPVLGTERVHGLQHQTAELGELGEGGGRAVLVGDCLVDDVVERGEHDVLPRPAVVRKIHRNAIEPRPQRIVWFESSERPVRAGERIDGDLFRG